MKTKGERREAKREKKRMFKESGRSVRLLWELAVSRAKKITRNKKRDD